MSATASVATPVDSWPEPDLSVLRCDRPPPPALPLPAFGPAWGGWIADTAEAAACPPDYVAAPLLAAASALIGNARWAEATPGWVEPPHLWLGVIGQSGNGKSPGADCLMRDVLPEIECRMLADFPDRLLDWATARELGKAARERWRRELRNAERPSTAPPRLPFIATPEPQAPRLRQHDVTIEKVSELRANAAPKGLLIVRDELAGWITSMNAYRPGGREFWIEAYGGRPYRVERKEHPNPVVVPRLAVAVYGGTQPEKLARLLREADDGLLARTLWVWPEPVRFRLARHHPRAAWAIRALDRLRELDLQAGEPPTPIRMSLVAEAHSLIESFAVQMQERQLDAGLLLSASLGKARGQALRLALVLQMLWWCSEDSVSPPPCRISQPALSAATELMRSYFLPTAERGYRPPEMARRYQNAATLGHWIIATCPLELHVRHLQRAVRLAGLRTAKEIREAADILVTANWLRPPIPQSRFGPRARLSYSVNTRLQPAASGSSDDTFREPA